MPYSYPIYDTALFGNVAGTNHTLFTQGEGASGKDATITNMRGDSNFPSGETFMIKKIGFIPDIQLAYADRIKLYPSNYLKVVVSNKIVLQVPLILCADHNAWGGVIAPTSAADEIALGVMGNGYEIEIPIEIIGGRQFNVQVYQSQALSTTSLDCKVVLYGELDMAG